MRHDEITYGTDDNSYRGRIVGYHQSPSPREMHKGAKSRDIAALKRNDLKNFFSINGGDFQAKFSIGLEVEKNRLHRGAVTQYPLFKGFETDSSCGYEAITNILPLLPSGKWRNKVFNMFHEANRIIDDSYSPSDYTCGGHITIGVDGISGYELQKLARRYSGILYALFRKRLRNSYCRFDIFMDCDNPMGLNVFNRAKYRVCKVSQNTIEFRLPSRFQSVKQVMRRYELMYELIDASVNRPNGSFSSFLKKVTPIVKSMYGGDMEKTNEVLELAKSFQKMINTKKVNRAVIPFIDPMNELNPDLYYDRDLISNGYRQY